MLKKLISHLFGAKTAPVVVPDNEDLELDVIFTPDPELEALVNEEAEVTE